MAGGGGGEEWWLAASPKGNYIIRESVRKPDQLASSSVEERVMIKYEIH